MSLVDVVFYIVSTYNGKSALSKARLTKLVFLLDWNFALEYGRQATSIDWFFDTYGPYVKDVINVIEQHSELFSIRYNIFSDTHSTSISIKNSKYETQISKQTKDSINYINEKTSDYDFNEFISFIYSLYPIQVSNRYSKLNLVELAEQYKNI